MLLCRVISSSSLINSAPLLLPSSQNQSQVLLHNHIPPQMEAHRLLTQQHTPPNILPPSGIELRRSGGSYSSSPEFEFWKIPNPSCPQPDLLSADELFVNGVLLPLDLLPAKQPDPDLEPENLSSDASVPGSEPERNPDSELGGPEISDPGTGLSASKRWRDIFKKDKGKGGTVKKPEEKEGEKGKEKKERERKSQGQSAANPAELNINIWPFSRSRSAGNSGTRPKMSGSTRKVSSAPCSRSNSSGESKSRVKWPSSPGRAGVHLGRSSPVWQVRRGSSGSGLKTADGFTQNKMAGNGGKARVLNLNVPMCIGYRNQLSCRSDESGAVHDGLVGAESSGGSGGSLFSIRNLFAKKVY